MNKLQTDYSCNVKLWLIYFAQICQFIPPPPKLRFKRLNV